MHILIRGPCVEARSGTWPVFRQHKTLRSNFVIDPKQPLTWPQWAERGERRKQAHVHTHTQTHANKRCTQMVAQDTICFCWLAPRQLIKHGVGKKFIPAKPISKQMWLIIQIWIYPFLFIPIPWDRTTLTLVQHTPTSRPRVVTAHGMFALLLIEF